MSADGPLGAADRPRRWRRFRDLVVKYGAVPVLLTGLGNLVTEVVSDSVFGRWGWAAVLVLAIAWVVLATISWFMDDSEPPEPPADPVEARNEPLPAEVELLDREPLISAVIEQARQHRLVLVHGPSGMGVSAVCIEAARRLAAESNLQEYIDLRGQHPGRPDSARRTAIRVLSVLGLRPGRIPNLEAAGRKVREALWESGRVLVLDNVTRPDQVSWVPQDIPGAYLLAAGDFAANELPGRPEVSVGPVAPSTALQLLAKQDSGDHPGPSVPDRISAEPDLARELAEGYLKQPRAAIEVGKWLAANPQISVRDLIADLRRHGEPSAAGRHILRQLLAGASEDARLLMANLARVPVAEVSEAAAAALISSSGRRTAVLLDELAERRLVVRTRPTRYRVEDEARALGELLDGASEGALIRFIGHYAERATEYADALAAGHRPDELAVAQAWFADEDTAMLELLRAPDPPPRAAAQLWQLADALEVWFGRENRPIDRRAAAEAMVAAARAIGDPGAQERGHWRLMLIASAGGDLAAAERHLVDVQRLHAGAAGRGRGRSGFHTNHGLYLLTCGRLPEAYQEFLRSRRRRPRRDEAGRVVDLINLGAVLLRQGRLGTADAKLTEALALAEDHGDVAGQAHAQELLGIVACRRHNPAQAMKLWAGARLRYEQQGDDPGQARCLLHTATALLAPDGTGRRDTTEAEDMLRQSLELRGSQQAGVGVALAHLHLGELAARRDRTEEVGRHRRDGLAALGEWGEPIPGPGDASDTPADVSDASRIRARLAALPGS